MAVGDAVDKGNQNIQTYCQGAMETPEPFDNVDFLLGMTTKDLKPKTATAANKIMKNSIIPPSVKGLR